MVVAITVLRSLMILGIFQGALQISPRCDSGRQGHTQDEEAGQVEGVIASRARQLNWAIGLQHSSRFGVLHVWLESFSHASTKPAQISCSIDWVLLEPLCTYLVIIKFVLLCKKPSRKRCCSIYSINRRQYVEYDRRNKKRQDRKSFARK